MKSLSRARLPATPWTAAHQAPLSMGFSRQEYWSRVPLPSPGVRLDCWKFFLFPEVSVYHYKLPHYKFIWFWQISKWVRPRLCSKYSLCVGSRCMRLACTLWCWFLPVLWLSCKQAPLVITATHAGGSSSQCRFSLLGSLRWSLGPSLLGKKPLQLWLSSHFWVATLECGSWSYGISSLSYRSCCAWFFISLFVENIFC